MCHITVQIFRRGKKKAGHVASSPDLPLLSQQYIYHPLLTLIAIE